MILVTVGTNEQPFDRLVAAAARLEGPEPLVVQHGASRIRPGRGKWVDFVSFDELAGLMRQARVVVSHAGVGSIMLARRCGRRPLVVPRRLHHAEAVDDHQLPLARRLHANGVVTLVEDERALPDALLEDGEPRRRAGQSPLPGADALATDLHSYLTSLVAAPG